MYARSAFSFVAASLLVACGGSDQPDQAGQKPTLVISGNDAAEHAATIYRTPTPNEFFAIVRMLDGKGDKQNLAPVANADGFATLNGRALNFGVYATDMVYASNFDLKSEVVRYYLATKKLGDQLSLSRSFDARMQARLEKNITHGDSLDVLTNDAYYQAYEQMQEENMGPVLALVLAGGWVESMHLVMSKVEAYDAASPLIARIGEQKAGLEQLVEMMGTMKDDAELVSVREKLSGVRDIFDRLNVMRTGNNGPSSSGRMVLGETVSITFTEEKYNELKEAIAALRASIIRTENPVGNS